MATSPEKRALLIAGPTASGKSALALEMAQARNGVIINADALQVYAPLRILSARPSADEEALAPHRLYGHVAGTDSYSVARWLADARRETEAAWGQGQLPIIIGGTGLYFKALEQGLADVPPIADAVREQWRSYAGDVHAELSHRDPAMAARLNPADRQRIIRALEVIDGTGRSLLDWQRDGQSASVLAGVKIERQFIDVPRAVLHERAERRFDLMMEQGALDEVWPLIAADPALPMMRAIGVPELVAALKGQISLEEAVLQAKAATRQYIKRQTTWWRGQMKHWAKDQV